MNRPLPGTFRVLLAALALAPVAHAQTIYFSDGRKAPTSQVHVVGDSVKLPLDLDGGGSGEISVPISSVSRLDWPEPPELAQSLASLKAGQAVEALKKTDSVLSIHEPFRDIPGSWWARLMAVRVEALAKTGRDVDAEVALERLRRSKIGGSYVTPGALALVSALTDAGKTAQARERLKAVKLSEDETESTLARFDLVRARILQKEGKSEEALLTFLRVPVLHPGENDFQPAALLGTISCYRELGETARAETARQTLLTRFPDYPEAAQAKNIPSAR